MSGTAFPFDEDLATHPAPVERPGLGSTGGNWELCHRGRSVTGEQVCLSLPTSRTRSA